MKTIAFILVLFFSINQSILFAQSNDSIQLKNRPFQITFISPMGTNGMEAGKINNNFSLNIFAGYNGGLSGIEIGGFANTIKQNMNGIQLVGFSNIVLGNSVGCQLSGFSNFNHKSFKGIQASGFSNIVCDSAKIIQISGFSNVVKGNTSGIQVSGFSNVSTGNATSVQIAGFSNVVKGKVKGTQVSGFCNVSTDSSTAIQVAGFNNVTKGDLKGSQISGFANITSGTTTGAQISGFFNYSKKLKGLQLGVVNYCDSVEKGIPFGVISIVKHGYKAFDFGIDETLYLNASFLTGVKQLYNKFSVGVKPGGHKMYWSYGYGIGSNLQISKRFELNPELSSHHILIDNWYVDQLNLLNKAELNLLFNLTNSLSIYGGVSWNVFVTNEEDAEGMYTSSGIVPWSSYSRINRNCLVEMYPGLNIGIRIH
jgi:hypothetical protein